MNQLAGDGATREQLIRRCMQEMWWLLQPAVVQEPRDEAEQQRDPAPREEEPEGGEAEVNARGEEELEQKEEEMEARGLELEDKEEEPEEERVGPEAEEDSALQSSSHEDPLDGICLWELEQQTLYTQESVQFSEQLQKEHREYEMQLQSKEPAESAGFYFNLEKEFEWQQNLFPFFQWNGENNWYGEQAGMEPKTGEFNGSHFLNQHNHF